jgi:hypothetical protein
MAQDTKPTVASAQTAEQELTALRAELARLKASQFQKLSFKVSEKGAISVYGMGRWPVTLYREQMERFLDAGPAIRKFIADNAAALSSKADSKATTATE